VPFVTTARLRAPSAEVFFLITQFATARTDWKAKGVCDRNVFEPVSVSNREHLNAVEGLCELIDHENEGGFL